MSRSKTYVHRDSDAVESSDRTPSWFNEFSKNLEKEAVKSKREDYSLFDQINNILGNKSKYSSVEEAVLDMQKRTGLFDVLSKRKEASAQLAKKYANSEYINNIPGLKAFIDNYVEERPGTSVEAVVHDLLKFKPIKSKLPEGDIPLEVRKYINDKIYEVSIMHPRPEENNLNLGKTDLSQDENTNSDNDPFGGCEPTKVR